MRSKSISAEKVATIFIARIDALEPSLSAFSWYDPDDILRQAQATDQGEGWSPLQACP